MTILPQTSESLEKHYLVRQYVAHHDDDVILINTITVGALEYTFTQNQLVTIVFVLNHRITLVQPDSQMFAVSSGSQTM